MVSGVGSGVINAVITNIASITYFHLFFKDDGVNNSTLTSNAITMGNVKEMPVTKITRKSV